MDIELPVNESQLEEWERVVEFRVRLHLCICVC